ncbi:transcription termination factor NusA [Peptoniphilaceae bacterium SGI.137]|nr:transcription termination factor NusA [Peptoniphilaceae bacterium]MDY3986596.1 transcription termination factor NusA [Peptoniphilaceae bacterium]MDY4196844.1 transcription termination factor NusA [Peptoniphilaceae bacterium]MDY5841638.1 transcription termination factor NusA [Peptoniphilaceae bacterium]MDY6146081.1 transcription termination factor NusA [Peptoniphilaceae bacterium]
MNKDLINALEEIAKVKGLSKQVILEALENALKKSYETNFKDQTNVEVHVDPDDGDVKIFAVKTVVKNVEHPDCEISLEEARAQNPTAEEGDVIRKEVKPKNFGRVAAKAARDNMIQKLLDAERSTIYEEYEGRIHEIITGTVQRVDYHNVYINLGKTDGVIPAKEQIPNEHFHAGDHVKLYVADVRNSTKGAQILLSRANPNLVARLFEQEVPEISDGTVEIYSVSREPGSRTKIAVYSNDPGVDPIGACVGYKGARVNLIVDELNGEKMDIIQYEEDPHRFIANSLSPSKVNQVITDEAAKTCLVVVPDDQLSLAIGKEGQNVRLAAKLTSWKIDIKGQSAYECGLQNTEDASEADLSHDATQN